MTIAQVVTRGYGDFGSVNKLPTWGYDIGAVAGTTTIYPNGDGTLGDWTDQVGGTTNLYAVVDEPIASPDDANYIKCIANPSTDLFLLLGDMPGDFVSMGATIVVKLRGRRTSSTPAYIDFNPIRIFQSNEVTALTDTGAISSTTSLANYTITLNVTGATTLAAWNGARLKLSATNAANGGVEITAIQVDVTYNTTSSTPGSGTNQNASVLLAM